MEYGLKVILASYAVINKTPVPILLPVAYPGFRKQLGGDPEIWPLTPKFDRLFLKSTCDMGSSDIRNQISDTTWAHS